MTAEHGCAKVSKSAKFRDELVIAEGIVLHLKPYRNGNLEKYFKKNYPRLFSPWQCVYFKITERYLSLFKLSSHKTAKSLICRMPLEHIASLITISKTSENCIIQQRNISPTFSHASLRGIRLETRGGECFFRSYEKEPSALYHLWQALLIQTKSNRSLDNVKSSQCDVPRVTGFSATASLRPLTPDNAVLPRVSSFVMKARALISNASFQLPSKASLSSPACIPASDNASRESDCTTPICPKLLHSDTDSFGRNISKQQLLRINGEPGVIDCETNPIHHGTHVSDVSARNVNVDNTNLDTHTPGYRFQATAFGKSYDHLENGADEPADITLLRGNDGMLSSNVTTTESALRELSLDASVASELSVRTSTHASFFLPSKSLLSVDTHKFHNAHQNEMASVSPDDMEHSTYPRNPPLSPNSETEPIPSPQQQPQHVPATVSSDWNVTTSTTSYTLGSGISRVTHSYHPFLGQYNSRLSLLTGPAHHTAKRVYVQERQSVQPGTERNTHANNPVPPLPPPLTVKSPRSSLSSPTSTTASNIRFPSKFLEEDVCTLKPKLISEQGRDMNSDHSSTLPFSPVSTVPMHHLLRPEDQYFLVPAGQQIRPSTATVDQNLSRDLRPEFQQSHRVVPHMQLKRHTSSPYLSYETPKGNNFVNYAYAV